MWSIIQDILSLNFLYGILASLLAGFIAWAITQIYILIKHRSAYSGAWEFSAFDDANNIIQKDIVIFRHNSKTGMLTGKAYIISPAHKWKPRKLIGTLKLGRLLVLSTTDEPIESTAVTHLLLSESYLFRGYVLRYNIRKQLIETLPVEYKKIDFDKSVKQQIKKRKKKDISQVKPEREHSFHL